MVRTSTAVGICVAIALVTAWARPAFTQSAGQESALLTEVRLLRRAIEALASNGSRIQLVFGRLQLQEQRTTQAVRRLEDAKSALGKHMAIMNAAGNRVTEVESTLSEGRRPADQLKAMEEALSHFKRELAQLEPERVRLVSEEADAAQSLAVEQARWSDLNRQVEDLERLLAQQQ
jgi:hypothetical protein